MDNGLSTNVVHFGEFELQELNVSAEELDVISDMFEEDEIPDHGVTYILTVLNRIFADKRIYIWRDDLRNSWLTVYHKECDPAAPIQFEVFSQHPTFDINNGLHNNQRELFESQFGQTLENIFGRSHFPLIEKLTEREDQFIYAIAIAFSIAMGQIEGDGALRTFPVIRNKIAILQMKYVIIYMLKNGLPTNDKLGSIWFTGTRFV